MLKLQNAQKYVNPPKYQRTLLHQNGTTKQIIAEVLKVWQDDMHQVANLAPKFKGANVNETAYNVWQFLRQNIKYVPDSLKEMQIKTPARLLYDGFGDCKGYSIFIKSVLDNLGTDSFFRFVGYNKDREPTHVYVVAISENGDLIPVDACIDKFNFELPYNEKTKIDMATAISKMNGVTSYEQYHSYIMCPCKEPNRIGIGYMDYENRDTLDVQQFELVAPRGNTGFTWDKVDGVVDLIGKGVGVIKDGVGTFKDLFGKNEGTGQPTSGGLALNKPLPINETIGTGTTITPKEQDNTMLYVLGGVALFLFMSSGSSKKK